MKSVHKLVSKELSEQIDDMVKKINEFFGMEISAVAASKIISYKSKQYNITLTEKKLIEILSGRA